jgi:hypothetical protein
MGGFVLDCGTPGPNKFPTQDTRFTLTSAALLKLARKDPDLIPDSNPEDISDESKADAVAKVIVCVQAFWFVIQVVGRLATGYAISLLEITTFAHALCCLVVYFLWWGKPMCIEVPSLIDLPGD